MKLNTLLSFLLTELAKPEAPKDAPLGQYLFAPIRTDVPEEENTPLEDTLQQDLSWHYLGYGDAQRKENSLVKLFSLSKQGLYPKLLKPPNGLVYRFVKNVIPGTASTMFLNGLPVDTITARPGQAFLVEPVGVVEKPASSSTINKGETDISSWTVDPKAPAFYDFCQSRYGGVSILMVAQTEGNNFFMNPKNMIKSLKPYAKGRINFLCGDADLLKDEKEVIGYGPINVIKAVYLYRGATPIPDAQAILINALSLKMKRKSPKKKT